MSGHTPLPADAIDLPLLPLRDVVVFLSASSHEQPDVGRD